MSNMLDHIRRVSFGAGLLAAATAFAQSPPATTPDATPSGEVTKSAPDESETLRIRGLVESADDSGVLVQLSEGIAIRVDIGADADVYSAARIAIEDLKGGDNLSVRTRSSQTAGETTSALEVLAFTTPRSSKLPAMGVNGTLKSIDESEERPMLVVTEGAADRRLTVTPETAFWRLQPAALGEVKAGMSISVLITREASGSASARRAVFATAPPGAMLPL